MTADVRHMEEQTAKLRVRAASWVTEIDELSTLDDLTPGQPRRFEDAMRAADKVAKELEELRKETREAKLEELRGTRASRVMSCRVTVRPVS